MIRAAAGLAVRPAVRCAALAVVLQLIAAAPTPQQVQEAEHARAVLLEQKKAAEARAAALAAQQQLLTTQRIEAAARLRALEDQTAEAADRVAGLARRRQAAEAALHTASADLEAFLPVVERLALYPAETLLAVPEPPERSVRGVLVLRGLLRQIEADAGRVRAEQSEIAGLQAELDQARPELARRLLAQAHEEAALDSQLAATEAGRRAAEQAAGDASRRAAAEAARATSLRAAIARLDAAARTAASVTHHADLQSPAAPVFGAVSLLAPVAGRVVRGFGDPVEGDTSAGLAYQVPPGARVVSPCGGRVVFSGPFRSYGLLAIIDCGNDWLAVLSGFARLDASLGQAVQIGEPIGVMPVFDPQAPTRPTLSMELRHNSQPVNPAPYLRARG
jgi:septal ring factor EnvC (AmiA/AmiB activator)